ncbi:hypothetical protein SVA_0279 [Sulfurifustis variabilis]|uniref:STAS/SEC14 domain-containing protein n=1 Tax=Sulfurifustis variabilis TaxID=1675686 RepID=A0A1B4VAC9_9GAMM|nr:hypothetical protein [Sulfurifustis variabilis]BAU46861.1 hypothetical protein SVA_0279 [Sulfurifustis variabilis]
MAFHFQFDLESGMVTVIARGSTDFAGNQRAIVALMEHPEFQAVSCVLCDFRQFEYVPTAEDCLTFGRLLASTDSYRGRRLAYVVASAAHLHAARTVAIVGNAWGMEIEVFQSPEAARRWLLAGRAPWASN